MSRLLRLMFAAPVRAAVIFVGLWSAARPTQADVLSAELSEYQIHYFTTETDANGRFEVNHRLSQRCTPDCATLIVGMTVAVQSQSNNAWYSLYSQEEGLSRYAWDDVMLSGVVEQNDFFNAPVRIVVFTAYIIG